MKTIISIRNQQGPRLLWPYFFHSLQQPPLLRDFMHVFEEVSSSPMTTGWYCAHWQVCLGVTVIPSRQCLTFPGIPLLPDRRCIRLFVASTEITAMDITKLTYNADIFRGHFGHHLSDVSPQQLLVDLKVPCR